MASKGAKAEIPADMWLHVAADALARYAAGGGELMVSTYEVVDSVGLMIQLPDMATNDPRLPAAFVALAQTERAAP